MYNYWVFSRNQAMQDTFFTFLHHLHILKKKNEIHGFIISFPAAQLLAVADEYGLGLLTSCMHGSLLCVWKRDRDLRWRASHKNFKQHSIRLCQFPPMLMLENKLITFCLIISILEKLERHLNPTANNLKKNLHYIKIIVDNFNTLTINCIVCNNSSNIIIKFS